MNALFPDAGTIRTVLTLASRAPSVHNTQPWRWLVGSQSLHLYADTSRQLPNTDPDGRDLISSCGAALNHCVVALAALGVKAWMGEAEGEAICMLDLHFAGLLMHNEDLAACMPIPRNPCGLWPRPVNG